MHLCIYNIMDLFDNAPSTRVSTVEALARFLFDRTTRHTTRQTTGMMAQHPVQDIGVAAHQTQREREDSQRKAALDHAFVQSIPPVPP